MRAIFVYGTMRRGQPHHDLLAHATPAGRATVAAWHRTGPASAPAIRRGGDGVEGEVYLIDDDALDRADRYEQPDFVRTTGTTSDGQQVEMWVPRAEAGGMPRSRDRATIPSNNHMKEPIMAADAAPESKPKRSAPKLPGDHGFMIASLMKSRRPPPEPKADAGTEGGPPGLPPDAKGVIEDFLKIPPPDGAAAAGTAEAEGTETPESEDDAEVLVDKLGVKHEKAELLLQCAKQVPELADLDAATLADKIGGDFRLRMRLEEMVAQKKQADEYPEGGSKSKRPKAAKEPPKGAGEPETDEEGGEVNQMGESVKGKEE